MMQPTMLGPLEVGSDTTSLVSYFPLPGFGMLPVNAFVIKAAQPVLVDTGVVALRDEFMASLRSVIAPDTLSWIWLTHIDPDHLGNLPAVLAEAPNARVVTTYLGMGKMNLLQLPLDRVYLLNPGQRLDVGDRHLVALTPPSYDAPETIGVMDSRTRVLFSADCFGALMREPAESAGAVVADTLRDGMISWACADAPWLHMVNEGEFSQALQRIRQFEPGLILSSHLPPAVNMTETLLGNLAAARTAPPFDSPDKAALERLLSATAPAT